MYLTPTLRRTLAIGGVALLAVVGLIGWTRRSDETVATTPRTGTPHSYVTPKIGNPEPVSRDPNALVVYAPSPFGPESAAPDAPATPVAYSRPAPRARRAVRVRQRYSYAASRAGGATWSCAGGRSAAPPRSWAVARPAEPLIGALAGGGKGAAIGALAGGGGGLIYDRATHKKTLVVDK